MTRPWSMNTISLETFRGKVHFVRDRDHESSPPQPARALPQALRRQALDQAFPLISNPINLLSGLNPHGNDMDGSPRRLYASLEMVSPFAMFGCKTTAHR